MSTYIDGATVHLDDIDGHPATIPARHLHVAARYAENNDAGVAQYGLHVFDRDVLIGARDLLDNRADRCTYSDQYTACDELAGTHADGTPMADLRDHPVCARHLPDDSGDIA